MAYDEELAERVREVLAEQEGVTERPMFGGLAFMVYGHMACGIIGKELMVRVGPVEYEAALDRAHARPMDFTGKPMPGLVYVSSMGVRTRDSLSYWVGLGVVFVRHFPPRDPGVKPKRARSRSRRKKRPDATAGPALSVSRNHLPEDASKADWTKPRPPKPAPPPPRRKPRPKKPGRTMVGLRPQRPRPTPPPPAAPAPRPARVAPPFAGIPEATARFLRAVARNNSKDWLAKNEDRYRAEYVEPGLSLVEALGPKLRRISRGLRFEARLGDSLKKVVAEAREAPDGKPLKPYLDLWFWEGDRKGWKPPGFYLEVGRTKVTMRAGVPRFDKATLAAYREAVVDNRKGGALAKLLEAFVADGQIEVDGPRRKTTPKGFDPAHPRADLLRFEGITATIVEKIPPEAAGPEFVGWCVARFKRLASLQRWMARLRDA